MRVHKIATGGFGDPLNHYAHSGAWFKERLLIGTSRANLQFLKLGKLNVNIPQWPVNSLGVNYTSEFEEKIAPAEIWSVSDETTDKFVCKRVYQSPYHPLSTAQKPFRAEISYRSMCVFKENGADTSIDQ